jgi:NAD(P)-dependent dehydrogenase (short-subunit alcohol dehydrogenase family)
MKLKGSCAVITGANQGFGLEIAKQFVREGANVAICARDAKLLKNAQMQLQQLAGENQILAMPCDITNLQDVEKFINAVVNEFGKINVLVANAGVYGPKGSLDEIDWEAWSSAIDINLKGTVLTCRAALPYLKQNPSSKIIILSGGGATKPMPYLSAYAASKAAVVRFSETLAEELKQYNIDVNAVAPGALNTRMLDEVIESGPEKVGDAFYAQALKQKEQGGTPLEKGVSLCVFLASIESQGITGKLISAVWDPWANLVKYKNELQTSDIFTLRRIVPEDRQITLD